MLKRKIGIYIQSMNASDGGPPESIRLLESFLRLDSEFNPEVITSDYSCVDDALCINVKNYLNAKLYDDVSLLHLNGLWVPHLHYLMKVARKKSIPSVFHTRGALMPWALNHKYVKKSLALFCYQKRDLCNASVIIASSMLEAEAIRNLGINSPIALIPNGVPDVNIYNTQRRDHKLENAESRTVLFLSRIHPVKGIEMLIEAWSKIDNRGWRLKIVGDGDKNYVDKIKNLVRYTDSIEYFNAVYGEEKSKHFINADIFVLPSFSENFGVAVAEALSFGLPVITTTATPWSEIQTLNCGRVIDPSTKELSRVLNELCHFSGNELKEMSLNATILSKKYSTSQSHQTTLDLYRWLLGFDIEPNFLI